MSHLTSLLFILIAYLIGSFPSGLIIGKAFYKTDIREHGSGNLGGSNAMRVLGKKGGLVVYFLDILKGGIAVLVAIHFQSEIHPLMVTIFSPVGHVYPIFAGFKGGKAVATSAGVIMFYAPLLFLMLLVVFFASLALFKMISLSSVFSAIALFVFSWWNPFSNPNLMGIVPKVIFTLVAILILIKHIPNYKRLIAGTEPKIGKNKKST
ncbi:MAG: glycerol-3-phosphate 1-O-acyltransferase PlsY [Defluviitaleaceae bacterium]|nr:glycerol-3-phosphate 1-O-acyltransferase PlsY [Defluviitaleaceae bacterium]